MTQEVREVLFLNSLIDNKISIPQLVETLTELRAMESEVVELLPLVSFDFDETRHKMDRLCSTLRMFIEKYEVARTANLINIDGLSALQKQELMMNNADKFLALETDTFFRSEFFSRS